MLILILRYIFGYVEFTARGRFPERFLNLNSRQGLALWNVRRTEQGLRACIRAKEYKLLRYPAKKAGVVLKCTKKRGIPFYINKHRKRWGMVAGPALCALILYVLSLFVWAVDVENSSNNIDSQLLKNRLAIYGIRPGVLISSMNIDTAKEAIMQENSAISWIAVNTGGSRIVVNVRGRKYSPVVEEDKTPCNLKALKAGQIISMDIEEGKKIAEPNQAVAAGDLLVSGVIDTQSETRAVHSKGVVCAMTENKLSIRVPLKRTVKEKTGNSTRLVSVEVFGYEIPLFFKRPQGEFEESYSEKHLIILGYPLDIIKRNLILEELGEKEIELTEEEAIAEAKAQLDELQAVEFYGARVQSAEDEITAFDDAVKVERTVVCIENIAVVEEIGVNS
ncbi:MAG: sporulation protein YqfD [Oscillospiraceae bacterium]|jgi:similar to stage IV sporulation protein|nr:sporulation protein YqfD [Oscillospiraceae bacterium]